MNKQSMASRVFLEYIGTSWKFDITDPTDNMRRIDGMKFSKLDAVGYDASSGYIDTPYLTIRLPSGGLDANVNTWRIFKLDSDICHILSSDLFDAVTRSEQVIAIDNLFDIDTVEPKLITSAGMALPVGNTYIVRDEMFYEEDRNATDTLIQRYPQEGISSGFYLLVPEDAINGGANYITLQVATGSDRVFGPCATYNESNMPSTITGSLVYVDGVIQETTLTTPIPSGAKYAVTYPCDHIEMSSIAQPKGVVEYNGIDYYLVMLPKSIVIAEKVYHLNNMTVGVKSSEYGYTDTYNTDRIQITHQAYLFNKSDIDSYVGDRDTVEFIFVKYENTNVGSIVPEKHRLHILYNNDEDTIADYIMSDHSLWGYKELASSILTKYADPYYEWAYSMSSDDWIKELGFGAVLEMLGQRVFDVVAIYDNSLGIDIPPLYHVTSDDPTVGTVEFDVLVRRVNGGVVSLVQNLHASDNHNLYIPVNVTVGETYRVELFESNGSVVLVCPGDKYRYVDRWQRDYVLYERSGTVFNDISETMYSVVKHVIINNRHFVRIDPSENYYLIVFGTIQKSITGNGLIEPELKYAITDIVGESEDLFRIEPGKGATENVWGEVTVSGNGNTFALPTFIPDSGILKFQHNISAIPIRDIYTNKKSCSGGHPPWAPGGRIIVMQHDKYIEFNNAVDNTTIEYTLDTVDLAPICNVSINTSDPILTGALISDKLVFMQGGSSKPKLAIMDITYNYSGSEATDISDVLISLCEEVEGIVDQGLAIKNSGQVYSNVDGTCILVPSDDDTKWLVCYRDSSTPNSSRCVLVIDVESIRDTSVCVHNGTGELLLIDNRKKVIYDFITEDKSQPHVVNLHDHDYSTTTWNTFDGWVYGVRRDGTLFKSIAPISDSSSLEFMVSSGYLDEHISTDSRVGYWIGEAGEGSFIISDITPNNDSRLYVCKWPAGRPIISNIVFESPNGRQMSFGSDTTSGVHIYVTDITSGRMIMECRETTATGTDTLYYIFDLAMDYITNEKLFSESIPHPMASYMAGVSTDSYANDVHIGASILSEVFRNANGELYTPQFIKLSYSVDTPDYSTRRILDRIRAGYTPVPFVNTKMWSSRLNSNLDNIFWDDEQTYNHHRIDDEVEISAQSGPVITEKLNIDSHQSSVVTIPLTATTGLDEADTSYELDIELKSNGTGIRMLPKIGLYAIRKNSELSNIVSNIVVNKCNYIRVFVNGHELLRDEVTWNNDGPSISDAYASKFIRWIYGNMQYVSYDTLDVDASGYVEQIDVMDDTRNFIYIDGFTNLNIGGDAISKNTYPFVKHSNVFSMETYLPPSLLHQLGIDVITVSKYLDYIQQVKHTSYGPWAIS